MGAYSSWVNARWRRKAALKAFSARVLGKLIRTAVPRRFRIGQFRMPVGANISERSWNDKAKFLADAFHQRSFRNAEAGVARPRVVHLIGSLQAGGAERQLCNCVIGQHRQGLDVSVLLLFKPTGEHDHFGELLSQEGITVRVAGEHFNPKVKAAIKRVVGGEVALAAIPQEFCPWAIDVLGELLVAQTDVFHSWLDHPNVWGGVGAVLANVPLVVLSTRNVNPTHFPYLASPYFHAMYSQFAHLSNVRFINNSHAGADDYAQWLGVSREKFSVVLNGVDFSSVSRPSPEDVLAFRNEISIPTDAALIAGVFRLSEEKQPLLFLEVVRRVISQRKNTYAVVAGIGPYEEQMRQFVDEKGMKDRVFLLGRRDDISRIFASADVKLLCSRQEGTPNVLLEAQWLGCPVVATKAGGAVDAVRDHETGFLLDVGDVAGLEEAVLTLLNDKPLRSQFAENGPQFIRSTFGVDRMVQETNSVYFN